MKVLVSGDEYSYHCNGSYYLTSRGVLFSKRYLSVFDEVCFAFRCKHFVKESELPQGVHRVTDSKITIAEIPFFQGPVQMARNLSTLFKASSKAVHGIDCAILRLPSASAFSVWKFVRNKKIPYETEIVFDCHDAYESSNSFLNRFIWKIMHVLQRKACLKADGVSCVTKYYLQKHYPAAPNAMLSHYSTAEIPQEFYYKPRLYPTNKSMRIVHIATQVELNGRKGHNETIDALAKVRSKGYDAEIVFIGGDYKNGIAKLTEYSKELGVGNYVHFTGLLDSKSLRNELINSNMAVLPTRAEGLPRVVIEAMTLGLPCITTPVSGNPELIDSEWLVEYDDVDGLANKIIELISSPQKYEQQSKINFERSKEYCNTVLNLRRKEFYNYLKTKTLKR